MLTGTTYRGKYTLWLDPAADYLARKIVLVKAGQDILDTKPISTQHSPFSRPADSAPGIKEFRLTVGPVKTQRISGIDVPVSAEVVQTHTYADGTATTWRTTHFRKDIRVNPDTAAMKAFVLDAPEGTKFSDQEQRYGMYIVEKGKLVLYVTANGRFVRASTTAPE